ncbi:unnamed protein product [Heligmosomoides polygyrus]|uniref:DUF5641 domain-containing protein n=1 Tax=Heligmosomoides polygyrus TaxID=6339 RepID=A0A183GWM4_HELPZ|nr:unnamed protein product [Heligmosomoides polygyrus]
MFLATVEGSANPEAGNAAYENYMQETPVNDAVVDAESILSALNHSLDELAVHNNPNIPPLEKYLQLQSLLTGDAIMVLDDVDPADNNYFELPYTCSSNSFLKHETRVPSSVAPGLASQPYFTVFVGRPTNTTFTVPNPPLPSQIDDIYDASHNLSQWYKESLSVLDHFWELWHSDCLAALRERHQARTKQPRSAALAPQLGDVVLIADEKSPRGQWNYGMIVSLISGKDGAIRVAEVRTASGKRLTRSISHLYPLEIRAVTTYAPPQDSLRTLPQDSPLSPSRHDSPTTLSPARTQPKRSAKTKHLFIRT